MKEKGMGSTIAGGIEKLLKGIYLVILCTTLAIAVFAYESTYFYAKNMTVSAGVHQVVLALIMAVLGGAGLLYIRIKTESPKLEKKESIFEMGGGYPMLVLGSLLLLAVQIFVSYHAYFMSAGDDVYYVLNSAVGYSYGKMDWIENEYLEMAPNNIMLAWVYGMFRKVLMAVTGMEPGMERFRIILIMVNCVLNVLTGVLLYRTARRMKACTWAAWAAWGGYVVLVGCSPYFLVPYSDAITLIMPLLFLELYAHLGSRNRNVFIWAAIGLLGGMTFLIKPNAFVMVIAIAVVELLRYLREQNLWSVAGLAVMLCSVLLMTGPFMDYVARDMAIDLSQEKDIGMLHYFNMGLNREREGAFLDADRNMALMQKTTKERNAYCLNSALGRIRDYGFSGMVNHSVRKSLANFADGSFAWGTVFDQQELPFKDNTISPLVRSIVYEKGESYTFLRTIQQAAWLLVLMLCPFAVKYMKKIDMQRQRQGMTMMLAMMGIITFNMLFEAKARYIFVMVPVFILMAAFGAQALAGKCTDDQ